MVAVAVAVVVAAVVVVVAAEGIEGGGGVVAAAALREVAVEAAVIPLFYLILVLQTCEARWLLDREGVSVRLSRSS